MRRHASLVQRETFFYVQMRKQAWQGQSYCAVLRAVHEPAATFLYVQMRLQAWLGQSYCAVLRAVQEPGASLLYVQMRDEQRKESDYEQVRGPPQC